MGRGWRTEARQAARRWWPPGVGGGPGPRVFFQIPLGGSDEGTTRVEDEGLGQRQGKVVVKYDRKELRKRLNPEEWILEQLAGLYDFQKKSLSWRSMRMSFWVWTRALRVKELLFDCYKPVEAFISDLLDKMQVMQKLSIPQKK